MLQFLHKPPLELYECFGSELKRAYKEHYLFEVTITDVISGIIEVDARDQFDPDPLLHLYLLGVRNGYVNDVRGFLKYTRSKLVMIDVYCVDSKMLDKIEGLAEDKSVNYAYEMGV
jgi:hypothetical protein